MKNRIFRGYLEINTTVDHVTDKQLNIIKKVKTIFYSKWWKCKSCCCCCCCFSRCCLWCCCCWCCCCFCCSFYCWWCCWCWWWCFWWCCCWWWWCCYFCCCFSICEILHKATWTWWPGEVYSVTIRFDACDSSRDSYLCVLINEEYNRRYCIDVLYHVQRRMWYHRSLWPSVPCKSMKTM